MRLIAASLAGIALFGVLFALIALRGGTGATYNLGPGETIGDQVGPARGDIVVSVTAARLVDVEVVDEETAASLVHGGDLAWPDPFPRSNASAEFSRNHVTNATLVLPGTDRWVVLVHNPNQTDAAVGLHARFPGEEQRDIVLAALVSVPSAALVAWALARQSQRARTRTR